jgi:hypothetical protein
MMLCSGPGKQDFQYQNRTNHYIQPQYQTNHTYPIQNQSNKYKLLIHDFSHEKAKHSLSP